MLQQPEFWYWFDRARQNLEAIQSGTPKGIAAIRRQMHRMCLEKAEEARHATLSGGSGEVADVAVWRKRLLAALA